MKTITFFSSLLKTESYIEKQIIFKHIKTNKYRELDNTRRRVSGTLCKKKKKNVHMLNVLFVYFFLFLSVTKFVRGSSTGFTVLFMMKYCFLPFFIFSTE